jgi:SAM-dependent methyltransferase
MTEPDEISTKWLGVNRANWDERVDSHFRSDFYDVDGFLGGRSTLSARERADLSPVAGRSLVHLQCHFGLDTLSWAREGAIVSGVDFSETAIARAIELSNRSGLSANFRCANVYDSASLFDHPFDIVYTGLGALCWLPDINAWAELVHSLLAPGGELYLQEFHPCEWIFGDEDLVVKYDYFTEAGGLKMDMAGSYADPQAKTTHNATFEWNHNLGAVITALIKAGITIQTLEEYAYRRYKRWPFMIENRDGFFVLLDDKPNLPLLYTLRATRPTSDRASQKST